MDTTNEARETSQVGSHAVESRTVAGRRTAHKALMPTPALRVVLLVVVGLGVGRGIIRRAPGAPAAAAPARWLAVDTRARTATLTLIAGDTTALDGFNFDGYGKGALVVRIPVGYRVRVVFHNKGAYPHSVLITPYAKKDLPGGWPVAFRGAASPDGANGAAHGATQRFAFVATAVGTYAIICAVSGHEQVGMWDVLRVTRGGGASVVVAGARR